jgi:hypothetical protein
VNKVLGIRLHFKVIIPHTSYDEHMCFLILCERRASIFNDYNCST